MAGHPKAGLVSVERSVSAGHLGAPLAALTEGCVESRVVWMARERVELEESAVGGPAYFPGASVVSDRIG